MTNILDGETYYGGWMMVNSVAAAYAKPGLKVAHGDAPHMEGKGLSTYSSNRSLCSIVSGHGIGLECEEEG